MHYASSTFSRNGQATMLTASGRPIPFNGRLSARDVAGIRSLYKL